MRPLHTLHDAGATPRAYLCPQRLAQFGTGCDPFHHKGAALQEKQVNKFARASIVISLGLGSLGAALAQDEAGARTRAEVTAERDAARASGWIEAMAGEDSGSHYLSQQRWVSMRTRAEVMAELEAANRSGELAAISSEDSGSAHFSRAVTPRPQLVAGPGIRG